MTHTTRFGRIMTSPWMLLLAAAIAAALGRLWPQARLLDPLGRIYLSLIELAVLPVVVAVVISGVAGFARSSGIGRTVLRAIGILAAGLVVMAIIGAAAGEIGSYGMQHAGAAQSSGAAGGPNALSLRGSARGAVAFLVGLVPANLFQSLGSGRLLAILVFAILFGAAVGLLRDQRGDAVVGLFDAIAAAGQKIISWLIILLPLGIIGLLAGPIARLDLRALQAILRFVVALASSALLILVIDAVVLQRRSREPLPKVLRAMLDPLSVAFATRSEYAALPVALSGLTRELGFYERSSNLLYTTGLALARFGNVAYLAALSFFAAAAAGIVLGPAQVGLLLAGSLLAGLVTVAGGVVTDLAVLSLAFAPLGLPLPSEALLLLSAEAVAAPLRAVIGVITTMGANSLIVPKVDALGRRKRGGRMRAEQVRESADFVTRVKEQRKIVVGFTGSDQPPFYRQGQGGTMRGVAVDVLDSISSAMGVELTWARRAASASELITKLRDDEIDLALLPPLFERIYEKELAYTAPYVETREAMLIDRRLFSEIHERGEDMRAAFRRFTGDVALASSAGYAKIVERMFPKCRGVEYRSLEQMAEAVGGGEVIAAFATEIELKYALTRRPAHADRVVCVVYNNLEVDLRLAVAPNRGEGIQVLNETITSRRVTTPADELVRRYRE